MNILKQYFAITVLVFVGASSQAESFLETFGSGASAFSIEFVTIGDEGNAADTTGFGSVNYSYKLGKYEISREAIEKANILGGLGITLQDYWYLPNGNGLLKPASGNSWFEAAKFVNYLNTSKNYQAAYNFDENGNFQVWGSDQYTGNNQFRHKNAYYFLPSTDEWYKGAYYDPNKAEGGGYWKYPTRSDTAPTPVNEGTDQGTAIYSDRSTGPADIYNAGGLSAYGTMAQGGNVWEWSESAYDGVNDNLADGIAVNPLPDGRDRLGGTWEGVPPFLVTASLEAGYRSGNDPSDESGSSFGFRVAYVPEPSAFSLLAVGLGGLAMMRRRRP
jgi:formylglycine-generating enzyme required for sulfatase activity